MEKEATTKERVTLYLTNWQVRMIKDYIPSLRNKEISKVIISDVLEKRHWVTYRVATLEDPRSHQVNIYLQDEQIARVRDSLHIKGEFFALNVNTQMMESRAVAFA